MENQPTQHCRNCNFLLPEKAWFCPNCGQPNTDGRLTFGQLVHEFLANLFNLDARIFRTLKALAVPGKLTEDYFRGKHVPYYHPVRLFIVAAGLFTAMLTLTVSKAGLKTADNGLENFKERLRRQEYVQQLDTITGAVGSMYSHPAVAEALDSVKFRFSGGEKEPAKADSITVLNIAGGKHKMQLAIADVLDEPEDSLLAKYRVEGFWKRLMVRQGARIAKSSTNFFFYLIGNTLWMMLVMMPMLAVVLKLLYIRRGYFYFEHLLFSFHTHTFVFLFYAIVMIPGKWLPGGLVGFSFLGVGVYLLLAMKRFYGQGWGKTLVKFMLANFMYFFVLLFALFLTTLASVALF